jgi:putative restriction endonuclease
MSRAEDKLLTGADVLRRFEALGVWSRAGQRAPHKPLLVLYAIARTLNGGDRLIPFTKVDEALRQLVEDFGPARKSYHSEYPFWRLQRDGVWVVEAAGPLEARRSNTDPKKSELVKHRAKGGLRPEIDAMLRRDPQFAQQLAKCVLDRHFPEGLHAAILTAAGLPGGAAPSAEPPSPSSFSDTVLATYNYSCAVCGYRPEGTRGRQWLEAAHIRWPQAGGPDDIQNGLCLCALHRNAFERGAIGISSTHSVLVCGTASKSRGLDSMLCAFADQPLTLPARISDRPSADYVRWHLAEVFKGPVPSGAAAA